MPTCTAGAWRRLGHRPKVLIIVESNEWAMLTPLPGRQREVIEAADSVTSVTSAVSRSPHGCSTHWLQRSASVLLHTLNTAPSAYYMFNHEILHISGGTFIEQNISYELPEGRGVHLFNSPMKPTLMSVSSWVRYPDEWQPLLHFTTIMVLKSTYFDLTQKLELLSLKRSMTGSTC